MQFTCTYCQQNFNRTKKDSYHTTKHNGQPFCSKQCFNLNNRTRITTECGQCNKTIITFPKNISKSKSGKVFCSNSCSVTYQNTHKSYGTRRSKLEKYLELQLQKLYPTLEILFNNKTIINSELDIYIPSLKLAFELNGIFHYEPIYGSEKLKQIQNNDNRKFQACIENNIELCIIDTSKQKYFKENTANQYLNIIQNLINNKLKS